MLQFSRASSVPSSLTEPVGTQTILVVDSDAELLGMMRATFQVQRHRVLAAHSAKEVWQLVQQMSDQHLPALALVESSLPDEDGLALGEKLLQHIPQLSLMIVSTCAQVEAKVNAILHGADDYITKPFEWAELMARVERSLKRRQTFLDSCCHIGGLEIDFVRGRVRVFEQELSLSMHEYRFLCCLARSPGLVVSYVELAEDLWPNGVWGCVEDIVKKVKLRLQAKLDRVTRGAKILHNVPNTGYYLEWRHS